jgi:hypothetical protein
MRPLFERGDLLERRQFEQDQLDPREGCAITANDVWHFAVESSNSTTPSSSLACRTFMPRSTS